MVKSPGFLKKLKKVGQLVGKGVSWVNDNIVKPLNPVIDNVLEFVPYGNTIKQFKDTASKAIDKYLPSAPTDRRVQEAVKFGADIALDTQRSKADRKYLTYNEYEEDTDEEEYYRPPKKTYKSPFGKRIN